MIKIKKILVATDFSSGAETAYPVAQKLASVFGSKVDMIHVVPMLKYMNESFKHLGAPLDISKDFYPKIIEESEHLCDKVLKEYIAEPNLGESFIKVDRKPSQAIVDHAAKEGYDLIVMGAKGGHATRMIRGSTTERVIRSSRIPVFCIDSGFNEEKFENILVPTDTSTLSFAALPLAVALADTYNASLTLYHVIELYGSHSENIPRDAEKDEVMSIYEGLIKKINGYLAEEGLEHLHIRRTGVVFEDQLVVTDGGRSLSIPLYSKIERGISAHFEIERYAEENADVVVIATHGHSGLAHLVLGSTSEKVAQYVSKPVLTVRPGKKSLESGT